MEPWENEEVNPQDDRDEHEDEDNLKEESSDEELWQDY